MPVCRTRADPKSGRHGRAGSDCEHGANNPALSFAKMPSQDRGLRILEGGLSPARVAFWLDFAAEMANRDEINSQISVSICSIGFVPSIRTTRLESRLANSR